MAPGSRAARSQLRSLSNNPTVTNAYTDFGAVGKAALDMTTERRGVELGDDDRQQILGAVRQLVDSILALQQGLRPIDPDFRTRNMARQVGGEKEHQLRYLLGRARLARG